MGQNTVVIYTTGVAGSGKTYVRAARFLVDEFLPYQTGKHISNFPLNRELIAETVAASTGKERQTLLDRLELMPSDVLESWRLERSGPWEFFRERNIAGCHIAIDEVHNFCGRHQDKDHRRKWQLWLGEIRHRGATVEFLTQNPQKVAKEIDFECGLRYRIENAENVRDPVLGITCADWYELRAAFLTGKYVPTIFQIESVNIDGKWHSTHSKRFVLDPQYFQFYDSFSTPVTGGNKAEGKVYDFQRYSKYMLIYHIARRNGWPLFWRIGAGVALWWVCFGGGIQVFHHHVMGAFSRAFAKGPAKSEAREPAESAPARVPDARKPGNATVSSEKPKALPESTAAKQGQEVVAAKAAPPAQLSGTALMAAPPASQPQGSKPAVPFWQWPGLPKASQEKSSGAMKAPELGEKKKRGPVALLCVAAWEQGAYIAELGSLLRGESVNGFQLESCTARGCRVNGVDLRVGVRTEVAPADGEQPGASAPK